LLKINPERNNTKHRQALDQLFYDIMEEKVSCSFKTDEHVINTFEVDVRESDHNYIIEAELPGFGIESISIVYEDNYLSIIAQKHECQESTDHNFIRRERKFGIFRRNFFVEGVDKTNITAMLKNGVLRIELPKSESVF